MSYAFTIPYLIMTCLSYEIDDGERFGNFEIYQPIAVTLNSNAYFYDTMFHAQAYCGDMTIGQAVVMLKKDKSNVVLQNLEIVK